MPSMQMNDTFQTTRRTRRSTAVSCALRAIRESLDGSPGDWQVTSHTGDKTPFRVRVASDRASREKAYRLAREVYARKGYVSAESEKWVVSDYDALPTTLTLLVEDVHGRAAATVTLVYDGPSGLPCDKVFEAELHPLRREGRRLAEVTRLVIAEKDRRAPEILLALFNFIYLHATRMNGYTDFVIEAHPRHAGYYRRLLLFRELSSPRPCPRVAGAPAVLLGLDLSVGTKEIERCARSSAETVATRTLYNRFFSPSREERALDLLAAQFRPMTRIDADYFSVKVPDTRPAS